MESSLGLGIALTFLYLKVVEILIVGASRRVNVTSRHTDSYATV